MLRKAVMCFCLLDCVIRLPAYQRKFHRGLPHGCKPPPLTMQHPCNTPQKPRTMAAVSPLHQVVPPQPTIPSYDSSSLSFNSPSRTSSFAAALRKLAKQAVDPVSGEKDLTQISPVSSPVLNQGSLTPKRNVPNQPPPPMFLGNHQVSYASSSPPVVTIAPSRPVATHTSESRKVMELSNVPQGSGSSTLTNGNIQDSLGIKLDSSKTLPRPAHGSKWDEHNISSKSLSVSSGSSQVRPHATIAPLPRPDDSLTSSRGFQPYRGSEESRNTLPHHISLFDHHHPTASYPYTPAFLPPPHLSHPAYRFDDPLYLERYSLLRPPVMPYPPQTGIMGPPTAFYPNNRYAADLIAQSLSLNSANNSILNHERLKQEEERRLREKELELDHSRNKEQERLREKEQKEKENREKEQKEREQREKEKREREKALREKEEKVEFVEHKKGSSSSSNILHSKRTESPSMRNGQGHHALTNHVPASTTVSTSLPLNLVVHPSIEPQKKEAELWMPWQQPATTYKDNQELGNNIKHPAFRPQQENQRQPPKEVHSSEKVNLRFSPSILSDKKHPSNSNSSETELRKYSPENKKFDSLHHHIAELSNKDQGVHEWRHEKLQKACTNSHRKSHESKKAKEDRNSSFQNLHRKQVNGVLIKNTQYQNEGMHARLLETEKCRLEYNGHIIHKDSSVSQRPNENLISERLIVPTLKPNYLPIPGKDMGSQKPYIENYSAPVLRSNIDLTPVVSKLDKELKDLQNNRFNFNDDDETEEIRLKNFLIITKGPPLKFDSNPQKVKFLKLFGLTTHFKRKKIEFDMYLKRRKVLLEDSVVPSLDNKERWKSDIVSSTESTLKAEALAETLRSETTPEKIDFLLKIGLNPITLVKKEERERIRQIVEEEKRRRHYRMLAKMNRKASPRRLFVPKSEEAQKLDSIRKMKEKYALNGFISRKLNEDEEQMIDVNPSSSSQTFTQRQNGQVPYAVSSEPSDSLFLYPVNVSKTNNEFSSSPDIPTNMHKSFNKYSFKRGHSLKREWRYSSKSTSNSNNFMIGKEHPVSFKNASDVISISHKTASTQVDSSFTDNKDLLSSFKNSFNWPGLEAVMEAFYRHQSDLSCERTILVDRYHFLRQTQEELKKEADCLSKHMSELLKCKRELEDERHKHQQTIENLNECLHSGRLQHIGNEFYNH